MCGIGREGGVKREGTQSFIFEGSRPDCERLKCTEKMARLYVSIEHLNDLLQEHRRDRRFLSSLVEELVQRNTKRARKLLRIVAKLLAELDPRKQRRRIPNFSPHSNQVTRNPTHRRG